MSRTINVLEKLNTLGVSLVKSGANRKYFSIKKSEGTMNEEAVEILKAVIEDVPADNESQIDEIFKDEKIEAKDAAKGVLRLLKAYKDVLPDDVLSKLGGLCEYNVTKKGYEKMDQDHEKRPMDGKPDGQYGDQKDGKEESVSMKKKKKKMEHKMEDGYPKPMMKDLDMDSIPEELQTQFQSLWKSNQEAIAKSEQLEKILKQQQDQQETKEYIQKAKDNYSNIPTESEKLGKLLKTAHSYNSAFGEEFEGIIKSVNEIIKKSSLFKEIGGRQVSSGTVESEISARAEQLVQKSEGKMSFAQAYDKIMASDSELYSRYLSENPKQR